MFKYSLTITGLNPEQKHFLPYCIQSVPCVRNLNLPPLEQETESAKPPVNAHLIGCFGKN